MSCYLIKVENGHKVARPITSEEEYKQLRGSKEQKANLRLARAGSDAAKRRLIQFNYSGHYPQGVVKGMKLPSSAFGFDMDEPEAFAKAAKLLLKEPSKYGLLMLERSARQGGHAVFEREKGKTILENQVRIATMLKCEMDTSAHDINRVYFTTTSDDEDLLFLSPRLFQDAYDEAVVAAEAKVLEERERFGKEELNEGAHKANKHYKPWENPMPNASATILGGDASTGSTEKKTGTTAPAASTGKNEAPSPSAGTPQVSAPSDLKYLGIPYSEIIAKWWQMYNDGQEPVKSNRNTLTFELAVNLRHICGFDRNLMAQVIPCYDGFPDQEKMACINSALSEKITQMPKRLKDVLAAIRQEKLKKAASGGTDEDDEAFINALDEINAQDDQFYYNALPKLPLGVKESVDAVGPFLAMPVISAICPIIGALATGVKVSVHSKMNSLNLISYIAGDFASGKGSIDPVVDSWLKEVKDMDKMYQQKERIQMVAHLLPLMSGEVELPKLEQKGRDWLEQIRMETMKNDDMVKARQRFRICPTTMRMMTCIMLCKVAEQLIQKHGLNGAEKRLKEDPQLWRDMIVKTQTPTMLTVFDTLADYQLDNALYYFRQRIEEAFTSKTYRSRSVISERSHRGKNDSIFERLDTNFTFEQALQQSIAMKGASVTNETARQMLKNWRKQGLIVILKDKHYQKITATI